MSKATTCPKIVHDVQSYKIIQNRTFSIRIGELFEPKDGSLNFYLKSPVIPWLKLDRHRGVLFGVAPIVPYTKSFKINLTASNEMGHVSKSFIIVVVDTDVVENIHHTLEHILSIRNQDYGYSHLYGYTYMPSLTEYLYTYFEQDPFKHAFEESIRDAAKAMGIKLGHKDISLHDFESLMNKINPEFEKMLRELVGEESVLVKEAIRNHDLRNLFREGSQATGTIAIPVWNHCAYPDLYNWPDIFAISNVMDAASDAVHDLLEIKREYEQKHQHQFKK